MLLFVFEFYSDLNNEDSDESAIQLNLNDKTLDLTIRSNKTILISWNLLLRAPNNSSQSATRHN